MKTQNTFLLLAILITSLSFGQITTDPGTGNIGIGTATPGAKLDVVGDIYIDNLDWSTDNALRIREGGSNSYGAFFKYGLNDLLTIGTRNADSDYIAFQVPRGSTNVTFNGNIGIGTTTLSEKLTVGGNILASLSLNFQDNAKFTVTNASVPSLTFTPFSMPQYGIAAPNTGGSADLWLAGHGAIRMFTGGNPIPTVNILPGKVGIGTLNPDEILTVKGKIHAEEIKVDLAVPADYVFQKYYTGKSELKSDYVMPTLAEIESFTKKNNHLPNVPSAKEIQEKGMSLGEMSNVLLQKVEELTLYAIEQQKKLEEQNKTIETQSKILETLTTRLNSLEKK